jgi:hypothetical protein
MLPAVARMTSTCHHTQLFLLSWGLSNFSLGWPGTAVLLISASHIPVMRSMSHAWHTVHNSFYLAKLKLCSLNSNSAFSPLPAPGNHLSIFCLCRFDYSRYLV